MTESRKNKYKSEGKKKSSYRNQSHNPKSSRWVPLKCTAKEDGSNDNTIDSRVRMYVSSLEIKRVKRTDNIKGLDLDEVFPIVYPNVREYCHYSYKFKVYAAIICTFTEHLIFNTDFPKTSIDLMRLITGLMKEDKKKAKSILSENVINYDKDTLKRYQDNIMEGIEKLREQAIEDKNNEKILKARRANFLMEIAGVLLL